MDTNKSSSLSLVLITNDEIQTEVGSISGNSSIIRLDISIANAIR